VFFHGSKEFLSRSSEYHTNPPASESISSYKYSLIHSYKIQRIHSPPPVQTALPPVSERDVISPRRSNRIGGHRSLQGELRGDCSIHLNTAWSGGDMLVVVERYWSPLWDYTQKNSS